MWNKRGHNRDHDKKRAHSEGIAEVEKHTMIQIKIVKGFVLEEFASWDPPVIIRAITCELYQVLFATP